MIVGTAQPNWCDMPHFYFNLNEGKDSFPDFAGVELSGIGSARTEAIRSVVDIARDMMATHTRCEIAVEVADEDRRTLFSVKLALEVKPLVGDLQRADKSKVSHS